MKAKIVILFKYTILVRIIGIKLILLLKMYVVSLGCLVVVDGLC